MGGIETKSRPKNIGLREEEKEDLRLLDGAEVLNDINGIPFVVAKRTGFPWRPEEVAEILNMGMV